MSAVRPDTVECSGYHSGRMDAFPHVIVIAGPNGAGKSTCSPLFLRKGIEFINADEIAKALAKPISTAVELEAGRLALVKLDALEAQKASFALETTLASRSLVSRLLRLRSVGYHASLFYLWLPSAELAIERVAGRVRKGGHHIPEETIRRRFRASLRNFFGLYQAAVDSWAMLKNLEQGAPQLIAIGLSDQKVEVYDQELWQQIRKEGGL